MPESSKRPHPSTPALSTGPSVAIFAPSPVLVCTFEHPDIGDAPPDVQINVGGQGPWVARAVVALGGHPILVAPVGGEVGGLAHHLLQHEPDVHLRAVTTAAATALYVEERRNGVRSCVREAVPSPLGQREADDVYSAALAASLDAGLCIITGSPWSQGLNPQLIGRLARDLASLGVVTVADLSGEQLTAAIDAGVDWLKIAHDELLDDGRAEGDSEDELWRAAEQLATTGRPRSVIVSRASSEPSLVIAPEGRFRVSSPSLSTVDARGSGDTMTAAIGVGLGRGFTTEDLLRRAAAAGAANAVRKGTANPDPDLVSSIARSVTIERVSD